MEKFVRSVRLPLLVLAAAIILSFIGAWKDILSMTFPDPDDALRLQQVRDLLGGQAWFDVVQHRVNPPIGGLMHWSRLIDLPLAIMIGGLTPLLGQGGAEFVAVFLYSVALLAILIMLMTRILRLYGPPELVIAGLVSLFLIPLVGGQFRLMRIDHHSAQMVLGAAAFGFTIARWRPWTGAAVGALLAVSVSISLEAIIYVPAFGLVFAWPWLRRGEARDQLAGFCLSFVLMSLVVMLATRGPQAPLQSYCDAMSRPYLAATAAAALIFLGGTRLTLAPVARWLVVALAGAAAIACLALADAQCLGGPFAELDPYTQKYWYASILEGLPIWKQGNLAFQIMALHLLALTGFIWALRENPSGPMRQRWLTSLYLFLWAMGVGIMVMRSNGLAHLFGLPAIAIVVWKMWVKARAIKNTPLRIVATVLNPILLSVLLPATYDAIPSSTAQPAQTAKIDSDTLCSGSKDIEGLNSIAPGLVFAQLDGAPMILLKSQNSVIATGHHRNNQVIAAVIRAFLGTPEQAHKIVAQTGSRYLSYCPDSGEAKFYLGSGTHNLAHALSAGHPPAWLEPVPMPKGATLQLYRIVRPVAAPAQ